jgi:two-component system, OmpR family, phosphate regulon sensor histidine kinase PhoR
MQLHSYFWKSFLAIVAIVLLGSAIFGGLIYYYLSDTTLDALKEDLSKETDVLAALVSKHPDLLNVPDDIARSVRTGDRLTLIAPDGTVLSDNWALSGGIKHLENHANRPEFKSAMMDNPTFVRRFSDTVQSEMLYYAVPIKDGDKVICVLRLSFALSNYQQHMAVIRNIVLIGALGTILLSLPFAYFLSRSATHEIEKLRAGTMRLASGDLDYRIPVKGTLEFQELASDFNKMGDQLNQKIMSIEQEHSRTQTLLSRMVEGVLALDRNGKAIFANNAFSSMFGLKMDRIQGKTFLEISRHSELSEYIQALLAANLESPSNPPEAREIHLYNTTGGQVFSVQASRVYDEYEHLNMLLLVFHDITSIKRVEQVRKDFVANVSHELRTPLTALIGSIEVLLDGAYQNADECKKFLEIMDKQLRNTQNLVTDMLALAAVEDTRTPFRRQNVELREFVSDILAIFEPLAEKKKQTLRVIVPAPNVILSVDPRQLSDAISNLLDNAIKYTDENGRIELICELKGDGIQLTVKDNGSGIPKDQLSRIFERFYRVDKSRSREMGGTGLGLAIAKHAVENHGGTIKVESKLGEGTEFIIFLPESALVLQHS